MKKIVVLISIVLFTSACSTHKSTTETKNQNLAINKVLNQWHKDVATFNYNAYFDKMTASATFVGTDATEVWSKTAFMAFSKPFFDKKQTWNFKPIDRNIYFGEENRTAWFDETLDTWMGVCRGSGVLVYKDKQWKIEQYVLSLTVPNKDMNAVIGLIKERN